MTNKGSMLILAYVMVGIILVFGATMYFTTVSEKRYTQVYSNTTRAFWVAEAGAQRGLWEINNNNTTSSANWVLSGTLGAGIGDYNISYTASTYCITSSGYYPAFNATERMNRTIAVTLNRPSSPYFGYAAFGKNKLSFGNGDTDSFNSSAGSYAVSACSGSSCHGDIGTNGVAANSISFGGTIAGNVSSAGNSSSVNNGGTVSGNTTYNYTVSIPPYPGPGSLANLSSSGNISLSSNGDTLTLPGGDYKYNNITLSGNNARLTFAGVTNLYVTGKIDMSHPHVEIRINSGASLKVYVEGAFDVKNGGLVNNLGQIPRDFQVYCNYTGSMDVSNNAALYGAIFAPTANLNVNNNADIYGSIVGKNVTAGNGADFHYDVSLGNLTNGTGTPSVPTWREL